MSGPDFVDEKHEVFVHLPRPKDVPPRANTCIEPKFVAIEPLNRYESHDIKLVTSKLDTTTGKRSAVLKTTGEITTEKVDSEKRKLFSCSEKHGHTHHNVFVG
jgi:hypothetical protein